jgi:uncharacterized protein YndB with AHSA1/START domain
MTEVESRPAHTARDLVITREFDAPLERVWRAWTEPAQLVRWFFPAHCTPKDPLFDVRPGGALRYTFIGDDGTPHRMRGVFEEIAPCERLVFTHGWADPDGIVEQDTRVTVSFAEVGDQTRITMRQVGLETEEGRSSHAGGWGEAFDHLAALLAEA